jgi:hypothetical protein
MREKEAYEANTKKQHTISPNTFAHNATSAFIMVNDLNFGFL